MQRPRSSRTNSRSAGSDQGQLVPLVEAIENNLGRKPVGPQRTSGDRSEPTKALVAPRALMATSLDAPSTRRRQTEKLVDL